MAETSEAYSRFIGTRVLLLLCGAAVLAVSAILATSVGAANIGLGEAFLAIVSKVSPLPFPTVDEFTQTVIWELRLPRILMAVVGGAGLAVAGAVLQGTLRNPLASPFTLGISAAAGFGAALAIILGAGLGGTGKYPVIVNAFCFSLLAALLVYGLSLTRGMTAETLVLAGIGMNFLFMALTSLLQYLGRSEEVKAVVYWLMGSLHTATWERVLPMLGVLILCLPLLIRYSWDLNALAFGDETARSLGVTVERVRATAIFIAVLVTASIVSFTGTIGFVCLISPHIARMIVGPDHRFLLPGSCLTGAIILLGADTAARTVVAPIEIPVGIMTAFLGVPLFVYLLVTRRTAYWRGG